MFPLVLSPGPANVVFALSGIKQGFKKSLPLLIGIDLVFFVNSIIIGLGLGEFLKLYPTFVAVIKLLGILYIIYLAYKFIKPKVSKKSEETKLYTFTDGVILQMLNPKMWSMLFLMFSLFLDGSFKVTTQVTYLVVWLAVLNISTHLIWITAGVVIMKYINSSRIEKYLDYFFALSLFAVAIWLLLDIDYAF